MYFPYIKRKDGDEVSVAGCFVTILKDGEKIDMSEIGKIADSLVSLINVLSDQEQFKGCSVVLHTKEELEDRK